MPVSQFFAKGLVSATVDSHFGKLEAAQIEFAPYGKATGLCTGVSETPYQNEGLSLQPCRIPGNTVWIIDTSAAPRAAKGYFALVNGSAPIFEAVCNGLRPAAASADRRATPSVLGRWHSP